MNKICSDCHKGNNDLLKLKYDQGDECFVKKNKKGAPKKTGSALVFFLSIFM